MVQASSSWAAWLQALVALSARFRASLLKRIKKAWLLNFLLHPLLQDEYFLLAR
jgi:hypothetical protein